MERYSQVLFLRSTDLKLDTRSERALNNFNRQGVHVSVVAWDRQGLGTKIFDNSHSIPFALRAPIGGGWRNLFNLIKFNLFIFKTIRKLRPRLIYACDLDTALIAYLSSCFWKIPFVYDQFDSYESRIKNRYLQKLIFKLESYILKSANLAIFASEERKRKIQLPSSYVIDNCPDQEAIRDKSRVVEGSMIFAGLLLENRLLESTLNLVENNPQISLTVAGFGPLEGLVLEKERNANINFLGPLPNSNIISEVSFNSLCLAVYNPSDPNNKTAAVSKVFESAIAGVPLVAAKGTSTGEIVEQWGIGWTITYGQPCDLLEVLENRSKMEDSEIETLWKNMDELLFRTKKWQNQDALNSEIRKLIT
jgi:glycosyltransferase involved in cell wall biosynthesis